jgi:hypothetical protein
VALPYHPANPAHAQSQEQSLLLARARPHTKSRARRLLYPLGQLWFGRAGPVAARATADARRLAPLAGLGRALTPPADEDAEGESDLSVNRLSANPKAYAKAMATSLTVHRSMFGKTCVARDFQGSSSDGTLASVA